MNFNIDPVEIAPKVWWVGHVLEGDPFQCHVYLIDNGEESILFDPGSKLTWPYSREKILQIMPLENIKYIVCHHQDPDITSGVEDLLKEIGTEGRFLVTHWRVYELLEHYDWGIEFYEIQDRGWELKTKDRVLKFIFTPYMHFPGAFCTYDSKTKILFSSDIFGGFTKEFQLFAKSAKSYFESMIPFHTHYMPSKQIVNHGLDNMEKYEIDLIAPQHGSIIKKEMIPYIFKHLRELECGIYLEYEGVKDVEFVSKFDENLSKIFEISAYFESFHTDTQSILKILKGILPLKSIQALALIDDEYFIRLDSNNIEVTECKSKKDEILSKYRDIIKIKKRYFISSEDFKFIEFDEAYLLYLFPLLDYNKNVVGIGIFVLEKDFNQSNEAKEVLKKLETPINIIAKHEIEIYKLENEKKKIYTMAITDSLTGLHNRYYLNEISRIELIKSKRYNYPISAVYLDLDHFKSINDTYGHDVGDIVLKQFAHHIKDSVRESDLVFRVGGEEFFILMPYMTKDEASKVIERTRESLKKDGCLQIGKEKICYTFSAGVTDTTESGHNLDDLIKSADKRLYEAKTTGRDKIVYC
jgi:diguanylate cyclase (GGDEF)-like protein